MDPVSQQSDVDDLPATGPSRHHLLSGGLNHFRHHFRHHFRCHFRPGPTERECCHPLGLRCGRGILPRHPRTSAHDLCLSALCHLQRGAIQTVGFCAVVFALTLYNGSVVAEILRSGIQSASYNKNYLASLVVVAIIMILINWGLSLLAERIERQLRAGRARRNIVAKVPEQRDQGLDTKDNVNVDWHSESYNEIRNPAE